MAKVKVVIETDETIKVRVSKQEQQNDGFEKLKCDMDKADEGADNEGSD